MFGAATTPRWIYAKPVKRGNAWRIQVRYKNLRDSVTRDTARECEQWAAIRLLEMKAEYDPKNSDAKPYFSFFVLCQKYYDEVGYKKRGKSFIKQQIKRETFKIILVNLLKSQFMKLNLLT